MKRITSFGWAWFRNGTQYAAQVGHEWNGETLSIADKRILRKLAKLAHN